MSRFFVPQECIKGKVAFITGEEAHHILDVMRLRQGDQIQVFDGTGKFYQGKILDTQDKKVKVKIEYVQRDMQLSNLEITLVQALPKKNKMDDIVEKSTELGVDVIIPAQTARTIVKLDKARQLARKQRWQRIAKAAAKQCGRTRIPQIKDLSRWRDVLSTLGDFDLKLLPCLSEKTRKLKDVLRAPLEKSFLTGQAQNKPRTRSPVRSKVRRIVLLIGPEGDFTADEVRQAKDSGCIAVSLGKTILKSDTAALCALAMITYELS